MDTSRLSLDIVKDLLRSYGLRTEIFTKQEVRKIKSPDFCVFKENNFVFYCEVKCAQQDAWLDDQIMQTPPGIVVGGERPDPTFNRLTAHIHEYLFHYFGMQDPSGVKWNNDSLPFLR